MEELYAIFVKGVRYFLWRQLGPQDLDDKVHDVFIVILQSLQRGDLREPERLMGYVRTVLRRHVASRQSDLRHARSLPPGLHGKKQRPHQSVRGHRARCREPVLASVSSIQTGA